MNLWQQFEIEKNTQYENHGISFHYQDGIEPELKQMYISFARWLRKTYVFPVHIHIHILNCEKVKLRSGQMAYGSFRWFPKSSLVHELSHYYQWFLDLDQSNATSERQANYFRYRIIDKFYDETQSN